MRFKHWGSLISDYNAIPIGAPGQFNLEEIRAVKACITSEGFAYLGHLVIILIFRMYSLHIILDGLADLKKIHLEKCDQVTDSMSILLNLYLCSVMNLGSIARCNKVKDTLESVTLIDLIQISEHGLAYLGGLKYMNWLNIKHFFIVHIFRNLKNIVLARLPGIRTREAVIKLLNNELPQCTIDYNDEHPPTLELKKK